jgi:4-hydroxy-tetrahydrodipicolinate synthase
MREIGRLLTAMVTPFDENGEVNYAQACRLAMALTDSGSDGLVITGTTGESPTLTHAEKLRLWSEVKQSVGNKATIVAGTGSYSTRESIELTRESEKAGADAALLVVPYYNKPTQNGLYQHFKSIAESTALPCILYNVPSRTIVSLTAETTLQLAQVPNIVGIKEASGDLDQIAQIVEDAPPDFLVWSGNDSDTFPLMCLGSYGVISVASHLVGLQIQSMINDVVTGHLQKAAEEHRRLLPLLNGLFVLSNPIPVKHAINLAGFPVGNPRLPLTTPDKKTCAFLEKLLSGYAVDLPVHME